LPSSKPRSAARSSVPVNWHCTAEEAAYILRDCDARAVVVHADLPYCLTGGWHPVAWCCLTKEYTLG
jgi:hypothetical protein